MKIKSQMALAEEKSLNVNCIFALFLNMTNLKRKKIIFNYFLPHFYSLLLPNLMTF